MQVKSRGELISAYRKLVDDNAISFDKAQKLAAEKLQRLQDYVYNYKEAKKKGLFAMLLPQNDIKTPKGLYIYGDVGRGKSMLMDLFFETLHIEKKRRVHFHAFMIEIHKKLYDWRLTNAKNYAAKDPLPEIASTISKEAQILCFDELQVTDIADAMILSRLFANLFENNVVVVATSNRPPNDLYKDGLQRENFTPFIDILKEHAEIFHLKADYDYRLDHLKSLDTVYFTPLGRSADKFVKKTFANLTNNAGFETVILEVSGRKLVFEKAHMDVLLASFSELCKNPLGAEDYREIAREFTTIIIIDIPKMGKEHRNEAKRFVTLVDQLYEYKVNVICTAQVEPDELYKEGDGSFEFARTSSRLMEMRSDVYMSLGHVAA